MDGEHGLTVPRILAMNDARAANRKSDLELWATMMATAQHDPKRIPKVMKSRRPAPAELKGEKWWGR